MKGVGDWESRPEQRATASRAAVIPRVHVTPGGAAVSLESVVRRLLDTHTFGQVLLVGRAGGGKTTALNHLRAVLPADAPIVCYDEPPEQPLPRANHLTVVAH